MTKVLHVLDLSMDGGVETMFMDFLAHCASDRRFRHIVLPLRCSLARERQLRSLPVKLIIHPRRGSFAVTLAPRIAQAIDADQAHVIYGQGFSGNLWACAGAALSKTKPRLVTHEHGTAWNVGWSHFPAAVIPYACSSAVLCNSRAAASVLQKRLGIRGPITTVLNGVDPARIASSIREPAELSVIPQNAPVVLFVGSIKFIKGVHLIPRIVARVRSLHPDVVFLVVGKGSYTAELQGELTSNDLSTSCKLCGFTESLAPYYNRANVVILPSLREPFGNVLVEAAMAGKPVVASRVDGIPEVVVHEKTGLLVDATCRVDPYTAKGFYPRKVVSPETQQLVPAMEVSPQKFADAISRLLRDPSLATFLGRTAHQRAMRLFPISRYSNDVLSNLAQAAAQPHKGLAASIARHFLPTRETVSCAEVRR